MGQQHIAFTMMFLRMWFVSFLLSITLLGKYTIAQLSSFVN